MSLKDRLKKALSQEGKKLSQAGLARACGIKPPSVSDWMSGRTQTLEGENLVRAAGYLGVNAHWLGTGEGSMSDPSLTQNQDKLASFPERLRTLAATVAGMFNVIPEDQWGEALLDVAEVLQKRHR